MSDGTDFEIWDGVTRMALNNYPEDKAMGPGTLYPFGLELNVIAEWFWRVQVWKIETSLSFAISESGVYDYTSTGTSEQFNSVGDAQDTPTGADTVHEHQLNYKFRQGQVMSSALPLYVSTPFTGTLSWSRTDYSPPDPPAITTGTGDGFAVDLFLFSCPYRADFDGEGHPIRYFGGLWWPRVEAYVIGIASGTTAELLCSVDVGLASVAATVDLYGNSVPLYALGFFGSITSFTTTGTVAVSPNVWWGYGGKFDTTTGARL